MQRLRLVLSRSLAALSAVASAVMFTVVSTVMSSVVSTAGSMIGWTIVSMLASSPGAHAQSTFDTVHPIYRAHCGDCHDFQGNGNLSIASGDIGVAYGSSQLPSYFLSGQTKGAATLARIQNGDMPLGAGCSGDPNADGWNPACLSASEQAAIVAWLQAGQPGPLPTSGTTFCHGDGSATACPCGNAGANDGGCANTVSFSGAKLVAAGSASISADTFVLRGSRMPNGPVLYFQGTLRTNGGAGATFGDGLRCVSGQVVRLAAKSNAAGASQYPEIGEVPISTRGSIGAPGDTRHYQAWYRNSNTFCQPETFNLTNGATATWGP